MNFITVQFSCPDPAAQDIWDRLISKGICDETRAQICHTEFLIPNTSPGKFQGKWGYTLVGAHIDGGIQERDSDYQTWLLRIRIKILCSPETEQEVYRRVRSRIGTPYDVEAIFGIALNESELHSATKLICSGFVAQIIDDEMHLVRVSKYRPLISPDEVRIACAANYNGEYQIHGNIPV